MSAKPIACRYGKNGYFGICGCPKCNPPRIQRPPVTLTGDPDALLALASGVPFKVEGDKLTLVPFHVYREPGHDPFVTYLGG